MDVLYVIDVCARRTFLVIVVCDVYGVYGVCCICDVYTCMYVQ